MGKVVLLVVVLGPIGAAVWGGRHLMSQEEDKQRSANYWPARKADFLVTAKLTGTLVSTDEVMLKSELEGHSTIQSVVEEGWSSPESRLPSPLESSPGSRIPLGFRSSISSELEASDWWVVTVKDPCCQSSGTWMLTMVVPR